MAESTSIKLVDGLKDRIKAIAADDNRSVNWLMNQALAEYADRREKRKALREELDERYRAFEANGRLHLTHEEVLEWMQRRRQDRDSPMPKLHK